jgi:hypothetical protein
LIFNRAFIEGSQLIWGSHYLVSQELHILEYICFIAMLSKISRSLTQAQKVSHLDHFDINVLVFSNSWSSRSETSATRVSELPPLLIQGKYCNETLFLQEELTQPKHLNPILMTLYF